LLKSVEVSSMVPPAGTSCGKNRANLAIVKGCGCGGIMGHMGQVGCGQAGHGGHGLHLRQQLLNVYLPFFQAKNVFCLCIGFYVMDF